MTEDTKFPETIMDSMYNDKEMTDKIPNPYKEWLRRCMENYPKPDLVTYRDNLGGEPYPWYFLEPMQEWYKKWFGQFEEEPKKSKTAIPLTVTHCRCPHCNAVDSMLVEKLDDKKGICIKCFKKMEFNETR